MKALIKKITDHLNGAQDDVTELEWHGWDAWVEFGSQISRE